MARTLAELSDTELEADFLEAERNALAWAELGAGSRSNDRGSRWMQIAGELRAEIQRRARAPTVPTAKRPASRSKASRRAPITSSS
jgi:hypothetical protein